VIVKGKFPKTAIDPAREETPVVEVKVEVEVHKVNHMKEEVKKVKKAIIMEETLM
jgi:hypothetical protein